MDEFQCPLCIDLLLHPVSIPCGHTFCRICIRKAHQVATRCPICLTDLKSPISYQINIMIQSLIEKAFPHEYSKRIEENKEVNHFRDRTVLPVIFTPEKLFFPGAKLNLTVTGLQIEAAAETLEQDKKIAVVSFVENTWVGWMMVILAANTSEEGLLLRVHCQERLAIDEIFRNNQLGIQISAVGIEDLKNGSWFVRRNYLQDLHCEIDKELEERTMEFTRKSLGSLGALEMNIINQDYAECSISSFFIMSVLKINNKDSILALKSTSEIDRLKIIEQFIKNRKPSRLHIRLIKERFISKYSIWIIIMALVFLYVAKSFKDRNGRGYI